MCSEAVAQELPVAAEDVWRGFGRERVLRGVSLVAPAGCGIAILGPNGAGKSTLLRVLAGLLRPQGGRVRVFGDDPWEVPAVRRSIGFCGHEPMLYGGLSARENLRLFACLFDVPDARSRVEEVCALFEIPRPDAPVRTLSRGLQQRVALARALVHRPRVLLLDEATTGLDPEATDRFADLLSRFRARGGAVVATTHCPAEAIRVADQACVLAGGTIGDTRPLAGMDADEVHAWYRAVVTSRVVRRGRSAAAQGASPLPDGIVPAASPEAGGRRTGR